jgi:hypothetical protein
MTWMGILPSVPLARQEMNERQGNEARERRRTIAVPQPTPFAVSGPDYFSTSVLSESSLDTTVISSPAAKAGVASSATILVPASSFRGTSLPGCQCHFGVAGLHLDRLLRVVSHAEADHLHVAVCRMKGRPDGYLCTRGLYCKNRSGHHHGSHNKTTIHNNSLDYKNWNLPRASCHGSGNALHCSLRIPSLAGSAFPKLFLRRLTLGPGPWTLTPKIELCPTSSPT